MQKFLDELLGSRHIDNSLWILQYVVLEAITCVYVLPALRVGASCIHGWRVCWSLEA